MTQFRLRHPRLFILAGAIVVGAIVIVLIFGTDRGDRGGPPSLPDTPYPVQQFPEQDRDHLLASESFDGYNSGPPTSGPHAPAPAEWAIFDTPVAKETLVHNMEHAGVVVWYNCRGGSGPLNESSCADLVQKLRGVVQPFLDKGKMVVMAPYPDMSRRIALTSWTFLDSFDEFDESRIRSFIDNFERRFNPEGF